jgi:SAM-dependent methyltransferase
VSATISMRRVEAETLDHLSEDDPQAIRSRRDLQRVNRIMGNLPILDSLLRASLLRAPSRIVELGAGDGTLLLRLAKRRAREWPGVTLTLVDQQDLMSAQTRAAFADAGWTARAAVMDVFDWLDREDHPRYDAVVANLFVHHFEGDALSRLFRGIARIADCFVACEPRRARIALLGSHLIGAIGANGVTRRDAVLSVRAGFRDRELSACWPQNDEWQLSEMDARLFSHTFAAVRRART